MKPTRCERGVLTVFSLASLLGLILGAVSVGVTFTLPDSGVCPYFSFLNFPFVEPFDACSSIDKASTILGIAVACVGIVGILWPIMYFNKFDNGTEIKRLQVGSALGSIALIVIYCFSAIFEANLVPQDPESVQRAVVAFSVVTIIFGAGQIIVLNFWGETSVFSAGNMDDGIDYIQM